MFILQIFIYLSSVFAAPSLKQVVIISDLNNSYGSVQYNNDVVQAIKKIQELKPDLVLSTGDMVAGQKSGLNYEAMWDAFHSFVTIPLEKAQIPFAVTVGNHDGSGYAQFKNERNIFIEEWKNHKPEVNYLSDENYPVNYSFEVGEALFLSIDSTKVGPLPIDQLSWLDQELQNHSEKKYKIIFTHVPQFQFNQASQNESFYDVNLMNILTKYKVDLYLSGHHHAFYPGFFGGIHFVGQGCLGAGAEKLIGSETVSPHTMTVIDFFEDHFEISALKGKNFSEKLNPETLPSQISAKGHVLVRKTN
jgi:predicted MPP superfamily phosphohydrolase